MSEHPLVVVSNRLPFHVERKERKFRVTRAPGGLVSALDPVLQRRGGVWVGWPGIAREDLQAAGGLALPDTAPVVCRPVTLSAHEITQYYAGFSNRTVWPLFHYFVGRTRIDGAMWRAYDRVNERFAAVVAPETTQDRLVWVHDYQLLRVPYHLRGMQPRARIALFLHIPFPAADVFRILPWSRDLLRGMLAADFVGFQIRAYAEHFLACAQRLLGCEVDWPGGVVQFEGREIAVQAHPISIDVAEFEQLARRSAPPRRGMGDRPLEILGVDRLDYTKGLPERIRAVERLFERFPMYRRRVVFTQVVVPSRERVAEYGELKREIDEMVGRVNGRFSERGWTPIRYLVRSFPPDELVGLYRQADIALVTPLRDGMNLVAKEYVVAQVDEDGVLVLSEMAGSAEELQEALLVNPFDVDAVAEALHRAMVMPPDERRARMSALRDRVRQHDVYDWVDKFLEAAEIASQRARAHPVSPAEQTRRRLAPWLSQRRTTTLFLDYDGTLTPITSHPADARLSDAARATLERAAQAPHLDTTIISGRSLADLKALVGVSGITYVGNHGFEIDGPGVTFHDERIEEFRESITAAADELATLAFPGGFVERKGVSLSYHFRQVDPQRQEEAERAAESVLRRRKLRVTFGKCVVEGRPPIDWHKGRAVLHVLVQRHGADWPSRVRALYIGDDVTDEDAFQSLRGIGRSVFVGSSAKRGAAHADFTLPDPDAVLQLVRWLASGAYLSTNG